MITVGLDRLMKFTESKTSRSDSKSNKNTSWPARCNNQH